MDKIKAFAQKLGRSMLIPVAAMPFAGLALRLSAGDLLGLPIIGAAGNAVFGNLDMLFSIGVALGFAKSKNKGMVALTSILSLLIFKQGIVIINPDINMGVFAGIVSGLLAAFTFDKFKDYKLTPLFAFFAMEKFPLTMIMIFATLMAIPFGYIWPFIENGLDSFALQLQSMGAIGVGLFLFFNRLLIPFGLHHVFNSYIYYELGSYTTAGGEEITGEMTRFLMGDPNAGLFLSGFFVVMMFGIPAICLAIYKTAKPKNKESTKGIMGSAAATSFITGITEPAEFSFMFTAPPLYLIHAIYAGLAGVVTYLFDVRLGFSFGSCIVDFVLNFNIATNAWYIIPIGVFFFALYYFTFYFMILKFDYKTIGREDDVEFTEDIDESETDLKLASSNYEYLAKKLLQQLGGKDNIDNAFHCITRLRVDVKDPSLVNVDKIKQLGIAGVIHPSNNHYQIIIGTEVSLVMEQFELFLEGKKQ